MKTFELKPFNSQVSFYRKAIVIDYDEYAKLRSYDTIVATIENGVLYRVWNGYSATTMRHINAFCIEYGLQPINKAIWLDMPVVRGKY